MSNTKHQKVIYGSDFAGYGNQDPITRALFVAGEQVVLCKDKKSLVSLRSLRGNNNECPYCGYKLNNDFTISGVVKTPASTKDGKSSGAYSAPIPPQRPTNSSVWWGIAIIFLFLCVVASALGVFGSLMTSQATDTFVPASTSVISTEEPNNPPRSTPIPTSRPIATSRPPATIKPVTSCSGVVVNSLATDNGIILHIIPCYGPGYDLGPFPDGSYKVSTSNKFIVYVAADENGSVYISKIGDTYIGLLGRLRRDHKFAAFFKDETPSYQLTLSDTWLTIYEEKFNNSATYEIPSEYSQ